MEKKISKGCFGIWESWILNLTLVREDAGIKYKLD